MDFNFHVSESAGIHVIEMSGKLLSKEQTEALTHELESWIADGQNRFVVDLQGLTHMNSSGLNILISYLTKARNVGGELVITHVPESINKLLIITKLNRVFHIQPSLDQALAALKEGTLEN